MSQPQPDQQKSDTFQAEIDRFHQLYDNAERQDGAAAFQLGQCFFDGKGCDRDPFKGLKWFYSAKQQYIRAMVEVAKLLTLGHSVERDYAEAFVLLTDAANLGDPEAMILLGMCYLYGRGCQTDQSVVFDLFSKAFLLNFTPSYYSMGRAYEFGIGTQQNWLKAMSLFQDGTKLGDPDSSFAYASKLMTGTGIPCDEKEALRLFCYAADNGNAAACFELGTFYENGTQVEKNMEKAMDYYRRGAYKNPQAACRLGRILLDGTGCQPDYVEALKWLEMAADDSLPKAFSSLALMHVNGKGMPKDTNRGYQLFDKAAVLQDPEGMYYLAENFLSMGKTHKYFDSALAMMKAAADEDWPAACDYLGVLYENGELVKKNDIESTNYFRRGAELGSGTSALSYGSHLCQGIGCAVNEDEGNRWFVIAADRGCVTAYNFVGVANTNGKGVPLDVNKGNEYFRMAAENGDPTGAFNLATSYFDKSPPNYTEGNKWLMFAVSKKMPQALNYIGCRYCDGKGFPIDIGKGHKYLQEATDAGDMFAPRALAMHYMQGVGFRKNIKKAIEYFTIAMSRGNAAAFNDLGCLYSRGEGVPEDNALSTKYYRKAAEMGDPTGALNLGMNLGRGNGCTKNSTEAAKWLQFAVDHKVPGSYDMLAVLYEKGDGVSQDIRKSNELFRLGVANNDYVSCCKLGSRLVNGHNCPVNHKEGLRLLHLAVDHGVDEANFHLGWACENGLGVPANLKNAYQWYLKGATAMDALSAYRLGQMYKTGNKVVRQNYSLTAKYFQIAFDDGHPESAASLGQLYLDGDGVVKNEKHGVELVQEGVRRGDQSAAFMMGCMNFLGDHVPKNYPLAKQYFELAVQRGSASAYAFLADIHMLGLGVTVNVFLSFQLSCDGARLGDAHCANQVGLKYFVGSGCKQSAKSAFQWFTKAAESDDYPDAICNLGFMYEHGYGVEPDPAIAFQKYQKSATLQSAAGCYLLSQCFSTGSGCQPNAREAQKWHQTAMALGYDEKKSIIALEQLVGPSKAVQALFDKFGLTPARIQQLNELHARSSETNQIDEHENADPEPDNRCHQHRDDLYFEALLTRMTN